MHSKLRKLLKTNFLDNSGSERLGRRLDNQTMFIHLSVFLHVKTDVFIFFAVADKTDTNKEN